MRWFSRLFVRLGTNTTSLRPSLVISQSPSVADFQGRIEKLDLEINVLKFDLLDLRFYIISPKRSECQSIPLSSPTRADRRPRSPAAIDAQETVIDFAEKLTALGPQMVALHDEIMARYVGSSVDLTAREDVENLRGYIEAVGDRYARVWERVDGILAMGMGGWEVGLMRSVPKELDALELRLWRV